MKIDMKMGLGAVLAVMMLPTGASAESWICEQGELMREIVVKRETANPAPCSVVYNKETENQPSQVQWTAQFDGAYCDAQANAFAEKLRGWGWTCSEYYQ